MSKDGKVAHRSTSTSTACFDIKRGMDLATTLDAAGVREVQQSQTQTQGWLLTMWQERTS
jgi:hypothetical protein